MKGFYGVAVYQPRHESNVGTLWRTAKTFDASLIATVGSRYTPQPSDTCKTPLTVPLHHYDDLDDLIKHLPKGCELVGVELDEAAEPLLDFVHPQQALYLLGAEDHGLPPEVLARCHHVVRIDSPRRWSLNVAVAGSFVMAHRYYTARAWAKPSKGKR